MVYQDCNKSAAFDLSFCFQITPNSRASFVKLKENTMKRLNKVTTDDIY